MSSDSRSTAALLMLDVAGARSYLKDLHQSYTTLLRERATMSDTIGRLQRQLASAVQVCGQPLIDDGRRRCPAKSLVPCTHYTLHDTFVLTCRCLSAGKQRG